MGMKERKKTVVNVERNIKRTTKKQIIPHLFLASLVENALLRRIEKVK